MNAPQVTAHVDLRRRSTARTRSRDNATCGNTASEPLTCHFTVDERWRELSPYRHSAASLRPRGELYAARVLFVVLTVVLPMLDVDSAFNGYADPLTIAVAVVLLAIWFAVWMRLVVRAVWLR